MATGWPYKGESEEGGETGGDDKRVERRGERVLPRVEDCECECTISTEAVLV